MPALARPPHSAWLEGGPEPHDAGQAPGVLHHVMSRSIEGNRLFLTTRDRNDFITLLGRLVEEDAMTSPPVSFDPGAEGEKSWKLAR